MFSPTLDLYKKSSGFLFLLGLLSFSGFLVSAEGKVWVLNYSFCKLGSVDLFCSFYFDWISFLFVAAVLWISSSILLYSEEYMEGGREKNYFLALMVLFVGSMCVVVFSLNLVSIMLGWDGLGLVSFLLVIYYQNNKGISSSIITGLSNRVGDGALLILIGVMVQTGVLEIFYLTSLNHPWLDKIFGLFLVLAAATKSAQIPFSAWLPRAMAAPTPVSALVHSSTLVTAGVYLMIRSHYFLHSCGLGSFILLLGMSTMLVASLNAVYESDLKKVVALSTLSQLGLMMCSLGLGMVYLCFFHLLTHAAFKALLFMCSGDLIHSSEEAQDIRFLGPCLLGVPFTSLLFCGCSLALCGFPFLSGFYSKDAILEMGYAKEFSFLYLAFMSFSVGLSSAYCGRLGLFSFVHFHKMPSCFSLCEKQGSMLYSKVLLFIFSVLSGFFMAESVAVFMEVPVVSSFEKVISLLSVVLGFAITCTSEENLKLGFHKTNWFSLYLSDLSFLSSSTSGISLHVSGVMSEVGLKLEHSASNFFFGASILEGFSALVYPLLSSQTFGYFSFSLIFVSISFFTFF
uniref:NADH dehydrogenase subunit 5 n=1 Tax=Epipenaeon fissurae TaxID=2995643 RepID=UPI0022FD8D86|nr:NADH dehydrogenase subunit 5 [Epipenaeon fissurae]WBK03027.1 NADH dehydrogenase subunit 5 [Epipenaeon fissurae]